MEMPPFLALDAVNRSISQPAVGLAIQRNAHGKTARLITSNDLNAGHRLAAGPLPDGIEALFFAEPRISNPTVKLTAMPGPSLATG
jgi:hypothetical protein